MAVRPAVAKALAISIKTQAQAVIDLIDDLKFAEAQTAALNIADEYEKLKAELED